MASSPLKLAVPLLVALAASPSAAEEGRREVEHFWVVPTTLGYTALSTMTIGMLGVAVGLEGYESVGGVLILTSLASGIVIGSKIGGSADQALARGETLSGAHKNAIRVGTVALGTAVGASIAGLYVATSEANLTGDGPSDEAVVTAGVAAGLLIGILAQVALENRLEPRQRLAVQLSPARESVALSVKWSF